MLAQPQREPPALDRQGTERPLMRAQQIASRDKERVAIRGETHHARRAREQLLAEVGLQPLELQADGRLRGVERIGGPCEAMQVGDQHEGTHRIEIEDFHFN
ncbi:hypothetical protein KCU90_g1771, partial [Aureobasidium melanogenum]